MVFLPVSSLSLRRYSRRTTSCAPPISFICLRRSCQLGIFVFLSRTSVVRGANKDCRQCFGLLLGKRNQRGESTSFTLGSKADFFEHAANFLGVKRLHESLLV